jgi:hypothetical protein
MKISFTFRTPIGFVLFMLILASMLALPFSFLLVWLVAGSPFWMWQMIFTVVLALLLVRID